MAMDNNLCDVCNVNPAIGVASTLIPYSCAYCAECARLHAQPEMVFICFYDDIGNDFDKMMEGFPDKLLTFKDGRYINYREWATTFVPEKEQGDV